MKKILLIGDSIPITPKIGSYVMLLENKYGKENIENLCISGNGIKEIMRLIKKVNFNEYENIIGKKITSSLNKFDFLNYSDFK